MELLGQTLGSTMLSRKFESLLWMYAYSDGALKFKQRVHTNNIHQFMKCKPRIKKFADLEMIVGQGKMSTILIASQRSLSKLEQMALRSLVESALEKVRR
jgi:hypothetical protein